jgi:hypothetical protein
MVEVARNRPALEGRLRLFARNPTPSFAGKDLEVHGVGRNRFIAPISDAGGLRGLVRPMAQ